MKRNMETQTNSLCYRKGIFIIRNGIINSVTLEKDPVRLGNRTYQVRGKLELPKYFLNLHLVCATRVRKLKVCGTKTFTELTLVHTQ